ncbi:MAG: M28 family peptidase [Flavobacterium sp.]|nr:M28 family peptidase [Flavobacterium sp.]
MEKKYTSLLSAFLILVFVYWVFYALMPQSVTDNMVPMSEFSTKRALEQVAILSKAPHYVGSENHKTVENYLKNELQKLGLQVEIQEGYTLSDWGNLVKSRNIIARVPGTGGKKALMLLSHYDSAPHSKSKGASDDASGIATILEGTRAFLHNKTVHKNDIIILFSDAEELGLNGAALFVTQHNWAKEVGLVVNFEARGSAGPSYMLMEVNKGNAAMVKEFTAANPHYPVSNSLMYSIYKMLPNDTDLTVFREQGKVQGFNFAFIDDHFNYHSQQDDLQHLAPNTLAHQSTYLMPLLQYFSNSDLSQLNSEDDFVYFNTPFNFMSYPFSWNIPLLVVAFVLFLGLIFVGLGKRILHFKDILKGFIPLFGSLFSAGLVTFFGWKLMLEMYPQYNDIQHGFTYNGHSYIAAFMALSLAFGFWFYKKFAERSKMMDYYVAPLFLWIVINIGIVFALPGAGFFIIPLYFGLISLGYFIITQRTNRILYAFLALPTVVILVPFVEMFPVGLGLKILFGSAILTILVFALLLPVLGLFSKKGNWSFLMFLIALGCFINAHLNAGYKAGKAKQNSLVYMLDADKQKAFWTTYDVNLDEWTKGYLGENPKAATILNNDKLFSKYNTTFTFMADAPVKTLQKPTIEFLQDSIIGNWRYLKIRISPNRKVNRYDIFANMKMNLLHFRANGVSTLGEKTSKYIRKDRKILTYYVVDNAPLEMQFSIEKNTNLEMSLMESSFDLLENPEFSIAHRAAWMMPTPFVLNDAVVLKEKIKATPKEKILSSTLEKHLPLDTTVVDTLHINEEY